MTDQVGARVGTATVVFTDLAGSTEIRARLGEDAAEELRSVHDRLVVAAIEGGGGFVVKHLGDGVMATFTAAVDAVAAAIAVQQVVDLHNRDESAEPLGIRVGISVGDVTVEGADCFGLPVVEAQRLEAAATPGGIVCADLVAQLARGRGGHRFESLGELTLKGLPRPVAASAVQWDPLPDPEPVPAVGVRVLGTTEVVRGEKVRAIASERQRRLLAALGVHAPRTVSTDALVAAVWGDSEPANAVAALRTVVTRLRHTFEDIEPGAGGRVVTRPPGYALVVEPADIDGNRFADLVAQGRRQLVEGDAATAQSTLGEALTLWRGAPYGEFSDAEWARAEATRLQRLWVTAREAELEARLACGRHAEATGDIERLVEDEPFSDGPQSLLMRAHFACGRQAEALRVFEEYRVRLAEETGLDPGSELRRLQQRVLEGDPTLVPEPGRPLRGYRLHEVLAMTVQGEVFRATQPGLERDVAVEVITGEIANDPAFVRTFQTRSLALAQIGHANVLPVYDCWRDPGGAYIVSRLLSGGTLSDPAVVDRLGVEGLVRVRAQIRSALDVAHQAGVVHGPIEAGDVQFDEHDNAYLANFRFAVGSSVEDDDRSFAELFADLLDSSAVAPVPAPVRIGNPYRGLSVFTEADVDVFFGRTRLVEEALATLEEHRAAVVVGPSGSGKSSVVRAGVIPALAAAELQGSDRWFVITMTPGARPFEELEAAVLRVAVHPPATLLEQLRDPTQPLGRTIQRVLPDPSSTAVLVVDQFEELFTLTEPVERDAFLAALGDDVARSDGPLRLIVTLRADHFDQPLAHPAIASVCKRAAVAVDAPSGDELRSAIAEPARVVGVTVEPGLVARMVADATGRPGALPLLQYTLTRLFDARDGDTLTLDAYLQLGGLVGSIGARAEELYEELGPHQRRACRRMFGRLVTITGSAADLRRRVAVGDLRAAENDPEAVDAVIDRFVSAHLLATDRDVATRQPTLEVAHEALFREWARLRDWITEDRHTLESLGHMSAAARAWRGGGDDGELYRGARLMGAVELAGQHGDRLTPDERAFVTASRDLADAEQTAERRQNTRLRRLLGAVAVLLAVALVAGTVAFTQRERAERRAADARDAAQRADAARFQAEVARMVGDAGELTDDDPGLAMLLAVAAHRLDPSVETLAGLQRVLSRTDGLRGFFGGDTSYQALHFAGGDTLVGVEDVLPPVRATTLDIWDVPSRSRRHRVRVEGEGSVAVLDERSAVVARNDGSLHLVDLARGEVVQVSQIDRTDLPGNDLRRNPARSLVIHDIAVDALRGRIALATMGPLFLLDSSFTELGRFVDNRFQDQVALHAGGVAVTRGPEVSMYDLDLQSVWAADLRDAVADAIGPAASDITFEDLAITPDGATAVVYDAGAGLYWLDARTGAYEGFTPTAAVAGIDVHSGVVLAGFEAIDPSTRQVTARLPRTPGALVVSALAPSGGMVALASVGDPATTGEASTTRPAGIWLWSLDGSQILAEAVPSPGARGASINPSGDALAWYGTDAGLWDLRTAGPIVPDRAAGSATSAWQGSGSLLTTRSESGAVEARLWRGSGLEPASAPVRIPGGVSMARVTPDDRYLVVGTTAPSAGRIAVYDLATGELAATITNLGGGGAPCDEIAWVDFSPDGSMMSVTKHCGAGAMVDTRTWRYAGQLRLPGGQTVHSTVFSPDGTTLLLHGAGGALYAFDRATEELVPGPLVGTPASVAGMPALAYLDDRTVVVGLAEGVRLWDLDTGRPIGDHFPNDGLASGTVSADGRLGVTALGDRVLVWNLDTAAWPDAACRAAGRDLTPEEWEQYGPSGAPYQPVCS